VQLGIVEAEVEEELTEDCFLAEDDENDDEDCLTDEEEEDIRIGVRLSNAAFRFSSAFAFASVRLIDVAACVGGIICAVNVSPRIRARTSKFLRIEGKGRKYKTRRDARLGDPTYQ